MATTIEGFAGIFKALYPVDTTAGARDMLYQLERLQKALTYYKTLSQCDWCWAEDAQEQITILRGRWTEAMREARK